MTSARVLTTTPRAGRGEPGRSGAQLSADDLGEIDRAASQIEVHGARYPEHLLKLVGR